MAIEVGSNSSSPPYPPLPPDDGALGYSRHYAKKIHDLGKSSRETWIQTLVDHVLHGPAPGGRPPPGPKASRRSGGDRGSERSYEGGSDQSMTGSRYDGGGGRRRVDQSGLAFDLAGATSRRDGRIMNSLQNSPYQPKLKIQQEAPVYLRKIVQNREGYTHRSREGAAPSTSRDKEKGSGVDLDAQSTTSSSYRTHHYPPIRSAPYKDSSKVRFIPPELAASPYLSQRQSYRVVPIEKVLGRPRPRPPGANTGPPPSTATGVSRRGDTAGGQRNPYLSSTHGPPSTAGGYTGGHGGGRTEAWRPPPLPSSAEMLALEKRAKAAASKAIKDSKIFTCEGPYPVDAYVRFSLRKRGWVEKFAPKVHNNATSGKGTSSKLECELDEDFDVICDHNIPAPWEEEHGVYAMMSRLVRHRPARFIWAGRAVNTLTLHQDVIVNHFPKARYFSSKTGITNSLKDLPWLASSDPHDFFPRCYLLSEDEREDLKEDFRMTACISLLKWVMHMFTSKENKETSSPPERSKTIEIIHEEPEQDASDSNNKQLLSAQETSQLGEKEQPEGEANDLAEESAGKDCISSEAENVKEQDDGKKEGHIKEDGQKEGEDYPADPQKENYADDLAGDLDEYTDEPDLMSGSDSDTDDDIVDRTSTPINIKGRKRTGVTMDSHFGLGEKVQPTIAKLEKSGGEIPSKAVDWALNQCERYIRFKTHEDLDQRNKPTLTTAQWDQFLKWYYRVAHDGATVSVTQSKLQKVKETLGQMKKLWKQYEIDGMRSIWIIKPGGKSKGIGIEFCCNLEDMIKYIDNSTLTGTYVAQKYIETPLLIYNTKFDIRQWFMVTDWNPLTVWFYKGSYLRICSQEFTMDSMHEAVHLSNVAIQQFYLNGERSRKLPEDNYMHSEDFEEYLASIGHPDVWEEKIYPGMKTAVVNTLLATMEISENKKAAFELYGADFMLADNFTPWLLEINASPGMAPTTKEKAKMCASVVEDLMKVVLDRRDNRNCDTGRFELVFKDQALPAFKPVDNRMFIEGNRIRKPDLQRYASLDSVLLAGEDPASKSDFLKHLKNKGAKGQTGAAGNGKDGNANKGTTKPDPGNQRESLTRGTQRSDAGLVSRGGAGGQKGGAEGLKEQSGVGGLTRSYTRIYGSKATSKEAQHRQVRGMVERKAKKGLEEVTRPTRTAAQKKRPVVSNSNNRPEPPQMKKLSKKPPTPDIQSDEDEDTEEESEEDEEEEVSEEEEDSDTDGKRGQRPTVGDESDEEEKEESDYYTEESEEETDDDEAIEVKPEERDGETRKLDRTGDSDEEEET